jgi:hypothetical protein
MIPLHDMPRLEQQWLITEYEGGQAVRRYMEWRQIPLHLED